MNLPSFAAAFAAAFLAGAINSVAGGGTMISFPVLLALGVPPVAANATSTIGIWPGSLGSVWGFRSELGRLDRRFFRLLLPAAVGGALGALVLWITPDRLFAQLVPVLLLLATGLFILQPFVQRRLGRPGAGTGTPALPPAALGLQFLVALYGGYFGAGMSILNLSILGFIGFTDILEMSAFTSLVAAVINAAAGALFIAGGLVQWSYAGAMVAGSLLGGYGAAGAARRLGKARVRGFVIAVGLVLTAVTAWQVFARPR